MLFKTGKIDISSLLNQVKKLPNTIKISEISRYFLGIPYKKDSLSRSSQEQLVIDFEGVDCITFIEYVEAMRLSEDYRSFIENLKHVRYFDGVIDFKKRRHFFTDWNELNTVKDITTELTGEFITVVKELNFIKNLEPKKSTVHYIPSEVIEKILHRLRTGDYCGFYTLKEGLDVTHVGIVIVDKNSLTLRHASSRKGYVLDEDLLSYIRQKEGIIIFRPKENVKSS